MASSHNARSPKFYVLALVGVAAAGTLVGYYHFARSQEIAAVREVRAEAAANGPRLEVVTTGAGPTERTIVLLSDVRAGASAVLYAKTSGYLKKLYVDKGDKVESGQVLAEVESLELNQQYNAASADLANKRRNLARIRELFSHGNTTQVALYQAETDATVAENNVAVLATNKSYQVIKAPFSGRVTARFADAGALITNAQTNFVNSIPVMTISDDTKVRVFSNLQQADVPFVHVGDKVEVVDAANVERTKDATITRTSGELDPKTRTMLVEVDLDNTDRFFVPGSFTYVRINVPIKSYPQVPVTALLTRGDDKFIAVLDNDVVRFKQVTIASTEGNIVSLLDGVQPGEKVAINVPDEITNGTRIQPIMAAAR